MATLAKKIYFYTLFYYMAVQTQIAFDFDQPQQPALPEKKPVVKKEPVPEKIIDLPTEVSVIKQKSTRGRKSLKEMSVGVDLLDIPEDEILFQKMYFR